MHDAIGTTLVALVIWLAFKLAGGSRQSKQQAIAELTEPGRGRRDLQHVFDHVAKLIVRSVSPSGRSSRTCSPARSESSINSLDESARLLYTREEVELDFEQDSWQRQAYDEFVAKIVVRGQDTKTFPCVYATLGYRAGDHRYVFAGAPNLAAPRNMRTIAPALREYLNLAHTLGSNTSLVVFFAPSEEPLQAYNQQFFDMLRGLRIADRSPWPEEIPQSTHDAQWSFCFDGEPVFPVLLTPAHVRRWSRHTSVPLVALQPKWVIDNLLATPEKRSTAQNKVRKLLAAYDDVPISGDLSSYGATGTREIKQLALMDDDSSTLVPYDDLDA